MLGVEAHCTCIHSVGVCPGDDSALTWKGGL